MKMPKISLPKFGGKKAEADFDAGAKSSARAKAPEDDEADAAGEKKAKGLKRFLPAFGRKAKADPDAGAGAGAKKAARSKGAEADAAGAGKGKGLKRFLPKFGRKAKGDPDAGAAAAARSKDLEDDETGETGEEARKGFKRFLPRLKGKARFLVPAAAALVLAAGGGGGVFLWRVMRAAPPAGETQAAAPDGAARRPEDTGAKPGAEAHADSGKEGPAQAEPGEKKAADGDKAGDKGGHEASQQGGQAAGHEGGGQEGGGHGKEKIVITPLPPPPPPSEIVTMVWRLQELQERIATGDSAAFKEMPKHLRALGHKIVEAPPETWENRDNSHTLIAYLLRGGSPAAGRKALAAPKFYAPDLPVAKAAIAYLENIPGPERDVMLTLDPMALDPTLGASVAFVQSVLLTPVDRARAIDKLDVARLLAPGGLVEEAALRREIGLLAESRQYDRFASLVRQYWARFRASPYSENFLRQFMLGVSRVATSINPSEWSQLGDFVESLTQENKLKIYLMVAQNASVVGNFDLAAMAARRAQELSAEGSRDRQRAIVYGALAAVGAADPPRSAHLLDGVDRAQLPAGDQPLYDAAAYVSGRIYRAPEKNFKQPPQGDPNALDGDFDRAEKLLAEGDAAIASARKTMARKGL
jgi:chemotaxis protein MotC